MNLKILGHDYELIYDSDLSRGEGREGVCNWNKLLIKIDSSAPPSKQEETLIHEILEALNYHLELELKHPTITALSEGLYQVLKDNGMMLQEGKI